MGKCFACGKTTENYEFGIEAYFCDDSCSRPYWNSFGEGCQMVSATEKKEKHDDQARDD